MGTSIKVIDRTCGHLAVDSEDAIRARLNARSGQMGVKRASAETDSCPGDSRENAPFARHSCSGSDGTRTRDLRRDRPLLVAGGIDLASVKAAMGHSRITTTERYLHARPAGELADIFTRALSGPLPSVEALRRAA
jgi:hypothetical protein